MNNNDWYLEKFKDKRWQMKRLEIYKRDDSSCRICNNKTNMNIQLHHKDYISGRDPWDYPNNWFITVCEECHSMIKDRNKPKINIIQTSGRSHFRIISEVINLYLESISNGYMDNKIDKITENIKICIKYGRSCFQNTENRCVMEELIENRKLFNTFRRSIKKCDCEPFQSCRKCKK